MSNTTKATEWKVDPKDDHLWSRGIENFNTNPSIWSNGYILKSDARKTGWEWFEMDYLSEDISRELEKFSSNGIFDE